MKLNIIAKSKSGKTYVILNNDGSIGINSSTPLCSLAQLKWLKLQPNFKPGFLARISDTYFENLQPEPFNITSLPCIATAVHFDFGGNIDNVRTWYGNEYNGRFCHFSKDGNIAFVLNAIIEPDWEFLRHGETIEMFEARRMADKANADLRKQEWLKEMYADAKGWYVVTLEVTVSKIRGNDGNKTYSFKVLANNRMDAYDKACKVVMNEGVKDRNVSFVYNVADTAKSALIEYVGVWTDHAELDYGSDK